MKCCKRCAVEKPFSEYPLDARCKDGHRNVCRGCRRKRELETVSSEQRKRKVAYMTGRREQARSFLLSYLEDRYCMECGEGDSVVLEFDHVRGQKEAAVTQMVNRGYSVQKIQSEIEKCEVVCANCHRRRTFARANSYRVTVDV